MKRFQTQPYSIHGANNCLRLRIAFDIALQTAAMVHYFVLFSPVGHSIVGLERLPDRGPAMIIYYHGALPIDFYYLMSRCILEKQRNLHAVGDNFLFKIPGGTYFIKLL